MNSPHPILIPFLRRARSSFRSVTVVRVESEALRFLHHILHVAALIRLASPAEGFDEVLRGVREELIPAGGEWPEIMSSTRWSSSGFWGGRNVILHWITRVIISGGSELVVESVVGLE